MDYDAIENIVKAVRDEAGAQLNLGKDPDDEEIKELITRIVIEKGKQYFLSLAVKKHIITKAFNSMRRLDVLQPLLEDETVTEIMVNAPDEIFIERDGKTSKLDIKFESSDRLLNVIQSVVSKVNRVVNEAVPVVDARLHDGSRVNVVLPPVALKGPTITIRKFAKSTLTMNDLIRYDSLTKEAVDFLDKAVRAKYNIFVCGGTGSGKTTFLNALSFSIPDNERVITIEDSAELQIKNIKNLVSLETRNPNTEGRGEITVRDLIKTSLRMRPDRIIVGEVRGAEALDMLQAMNTGHDGSLSTGHANTTRDMLSRIETMVLSAANLPVEVIRKNISAALDLIIHVARLRDGSRKVLEISEITGIQNGEIVLNTLFKFEECGDDNGKVLGKLKKTGNKIINILKSGMAGIKFEN